MSPRLASLDAKWSHASIASSLNKRILPMHCGERRARAEITDTPVAEIEIDNALVMALLEQQHPNLARLPLRSVQGGWDNAMFRLGESFAVRLPRRQAAAVLIEVEQRWLIQLSDALPLPTPVPLRTGHAGCGFPWRWSIVPWLVGVTADVVPLRSGQAAALGQFLRALHVPAPVDAPHNPYRSVALADRATALEERMQRVAEKTDFITPRIREVWLRAVATQIDTESTWIHGDLHPRNVLTVEGKISGIIDWGDMASGDRATDLACLWMLLPQDQRNIALQAYGPISDATVERARGWAILFGIVLLDTGLIGDPRNASIGAEILRRI
jgi:aminoglycoside phosphotransferase (APT) family kinase protein